jgi:hypothetical protein
LAKAAAQLLAGTERGSHVYGEIRDRLDTIEGRSTVSKAIAEAVAQQAIKDPEILERGKARFLGGLLQKQENMEAVVAVADEQILLLPSAGTASKSASGAEAVCNPDQSQTTDPDLDENQASTQPLNADWAATFSNLAENATSDDLRQRLGRVLAGELASPGTYSRATVRKIAELERDDLEAMKKILPFVFDEFVIRMNGDEQEPSLDLLLPLAEVGLITEASGTISRNWKPAPPEGASCVVIGTEWVMQVDVPGNHAMSIGICQLTRTGIAVVDLLGRPDEREIIRRMAANPAPEWKAIRMAKLNGTGRIHPPWQQLYPPPVSQTMPPVAGRSPFAPNVVSENAGDQSGEPTV